jgi:hypothetical protein
MCSDLPYLTGYIYVGWVNLAIICDRNVTIDVAAGVRRQKLTLSVGPRRRQNSVSEMALFKMKDRTMDDVQNCVSYINTIVTNLQIALTCWVLSLDTMCTMRYGQNYIVDKF